VITVVTPVSPIPSHPDTAILDETIESVRHHLPDAEILITFDGVRPEQEHRRADYEEFMRRALWKVDHAWGKCAAWIYDDHTHQVGMLRGIIDEIQTPLMMYVEQDTPLVTDEPIDWDAITRFILDGHSNCVRLAHEAVIPGEHMHLMHGDDQGFIRTSQYSARPHVASVAYYRRLLDHFSPNACSFLEDKLYGVVDEAFHIDGLAGWRQHRIHIYNPGQNMKRSYHLDGRAGEPKWDELQVF